MKLFSVYIATIGIVTFISGCATSGKMNNVSIGMTRQQVVQKIGEPDAVSAQAGAEYLSYYLCYSNCRAWLPQARMQDWYYVRLINGTVESYGKKGDFDSTKVPTARIERVDSVKQDINIQSSDNISQSDKYVELTKLKTLLDDGIISKEEFDEQKKIIFAR